MIFIRTFFTFIRIFSSNYTNSQWNEAFISFKKFCKIWRKIIIIESENDLYDNHTVSGNKIFLMEKPWLYTNLLGRLDFFIKYGGYFREGPIEDKYSSFHKSLSYELHIKQYYFIYLEEYKKMRKEQLLPYNLSEEKIRIIDNYVLYLSRQEKLKRITKI